MNKFIVLLAVVAASVALASAMVVPPEDEMSQLSLNPGDEDETKKLDGTPFQPFSDFCLQTRDHVVEDIKTRSNIYASSLFNQVFKTIGEIGQGTIEANNMATGKLANQLRNPDAEIDEASQGELDKIVADGQQAIKEASSQPQGFLAAFKAGIFNLASVGYGLTVSKINQASENIRNQFEVVKALVEFCEKLSSYEEKAIEIFEATKEDLMKLDPEQFENVRYSQVAPKCVTANRLSRAEGFCKFVLAAKDPVAKMINLELPKNHSEQ